MNTHDVFEKWKHLDHLFKPCKYRLEYFSFEEWFLEHYMEFCHV